MKISVIIADDHPIVLDGLAQLFAGETDIQVLARCGNGAETLSAVRRTPPDVLVLDLHMPVLDGLAVLRALREMRQSTRVVLITGQLTDAEMIDAVNLGVAAIVLKDTASRQLLESVRAVAAGTPTLDRAAVQAALDRLQTRDDTLRRASKELTRRELDIVRMVAVGARNKEIAEKLGISEGTVKMHLHTIYDKLRISGRVPLSIYARDHGVV